MTISKTIEELQSAENSIKSLNSDILDRIRKQQSSDANSSYVAPNANEGMDRTQMFRPVLRPVFARSIAR